MRSAASATVRWSGGLIIGRLPRDCIWSGKDYLTPVTLSTGFRLLSFPSSCLGTGASDAPRRRKPASLSHHSGFERRRASHPAVTQQEPGDERIPNPTAYSLSYVRRS